MPAKALAQRFALALLLGASVALLIWSEVNQDAASRLRARAVDALAPVLEVLTRPVDTIGNIAAAIDDLWFTYSENERLREENERLLKWQAIARRLEQENALYRAQLHVKSEPLPTFVSARVIADFGGPFVRTVLLNAGRRDGVQDGQGVVTGAGLAGRIIETGEQSSRILLLTDLNSRVPVVLEGSRERAILAGDNSAEPRLVFLPLTAEPQVGIRVVTSGHGGVLQPGIPVGVVSKVERGEVRVRPFVDGDRLEFVSVVRFELPKLQQNGPTVRLEDRWGMGAP